MKHGWMAAAICLAVLGAGCIDTPSSRGPAEPGFEGKFGVSLDRGALVFGEGVRTVPSPTGEPVVARPFIVDGQNQSLTMYVDIATGEPLGSFRDGSEGVDFFDHVTPGLGGLHQYPVFLGVKAIQAKVNPGDVLHYLGMAFDVEEAGGDEILVSLEIDTPHSQTRFLYRIEAKASLEGLRIMSPTSNHEAPVWMHDGMPPWPEFDAPLSTRFHPPDDLPFGPSGTVPPTGGAMPFSLETALDGLREHNADVDMFLKRNPQAVTTRAHYDPDAAGTADSVYRHRWSMTLTGDGETLEATVVAMSDPVTAQAIRETIHDEGVSITANGAGWSGAEDLQVLAVSGVFEECSQGLARGQVQLDYAWFGGAQGIIAGGLPLAGLSTWACGDFLIGPAWDAATGMRVRTFVE